MGMLVLSDIFCTFSRNTKLPNFGNHRLIKTQIGHARDFAWYRGQRPSPACVTARDSVTRACTDSRAQKPLQLRDKSATLSRAWFVIVRHLDYILITRAGDGRWPRYQVKSLACPGCVGNIFREKYSSYFYKQGVIWKVIQFRKFSRQLSFKCF